MKSDTNSKSKLSPTLNRPNDLDRMKLIEALSQTIINFSNHLMSMKKELDVLSEKMANLEIETRTSNVRDADK